MLGYLKVCFVRLGYQKKRFKISEVVDLTPQPKRLQCPASTFVGERSSSFVRSQVQSDCHRLVAARLPHHVSVETAC